MLRRALLLIWFVARVPARIPVDPTVRRPVFLDWSDGWKSLE